jgi:hypothetical protein
MDASLAIGWGLVTLASIAAAAWLAAHPPALASDDAEPSGTAVATNEGVFPLRALLPGLRIYDMHYPADARLGLATAAGQVRPYPGTSRRRRPVGRAEVFERA